MTEESLFHEALAKPPADRAAFLDAACAGKPELRAAVDALLAAHKGSGSFLDEPAAAPNLTSHHTPDPDVAPGLRSTADYQPAIATDVVIAGRYTLVEMVGEGGMGEVWVAKQTEPVKRRVAIKLIKAGMDSKAVLQRFEQERQALAMMDHPSIAKVLDGGVTSAGHPFFVMELVNGMPLTQYCDDANLTPRERLELFVPICQAVQHAHQKGIVHRDLKPSNILVTLYDGKPVPKVIDFGVAKAVAGKLTDESLSTQFGAVVGTLEYMAPEQAGLTAIDIDTRADIYSLGVILYELLTGLQPFDRKRLRRAALDEVIRILREEEPSKPSTRLSTDDALPSLAAHRHTEPKRLMALLRGDLDCIVMKALEKDRNRRYETANGFARDVQRFLADEPVEAQPPAMRYRLRKFLRRNKGPVLATSLVLVMLLIGLIAGTAGIIWHQNEEANRATAEAKRQADKERKHALAEQAIGAALDQAEASREELQQILRKPGGVFGLLNEPKRWQAQIQLTQGAVERAKALRANADGPVQPGLNTRIQHLENLLGQDEVDRQLALRLDKIRMNASALVEGRFDYATARREYPRTFEDAKLPVQNGDLQTVANRIASSAIKEQLVASLDDWAYVNLGTGEKGIPERLFELARLASPDPGLGDRLRQPKHWKDRKALMLMAKEIPPTALSPQLIRLVSGLVERDELANEAWLRQGQAQYPADFWLNLHLGNALNEIKPLEAEGFYRVALAVRPESGAAYHNLGGALQVQNRPAEAIAAYQKAIALEPRFASAYYALGLTLSNENRPAEAITAYQKAIDSDPKYVKAYHNLAIVLHHQNRPAEAIATLKKAIQIQPTQFQSHGAMAEVLFKQGSFAEAAAAYQAALDAGHPKQVAIRGYLQDCRQMLARENRLLVVLKNKGAAAPDELLLLAHLCMRFKMRHATAASLYDDAFKAKPQLADDQSKRHRYYAACAAALAGCGQGEEATKLKDEEKSKWRRQARAWLQSELNQYAKEWKADSSKAAIPVAVRLSDWQQDSDLAGVRDPKQLATLPDDEQKAWQELWSDARQLLKAAQSRFTETRLQGILSDKNTTRVHEIKMTTGKTYVIDMESKDFDTFLKLEDALGRPLAENDDIDFQANNLNSRILFVPAKDGTYRVAATSFEQQARGRYEIIIREFAGKEKQPVK